MKEWGYDACFRPDKVVRCQSSHICDADSCYNFIVCKKYKELRDFFFKFGFIVYPYTYSMLKRYKSLGFLYTKMRNVLFVNIACFLDEFDDDPIYFALFVAFHEFLHAVPPKCWEYTLLLASLDYNDLNDYATKGNTIGQLIEIYGEEEIFERNELVHRYIANNPETKSMLNAIYKDDRTYKPLEKFANVYNCLLNLLKMAANNKSPFMHP